MTLYDSMVESYAPKSAAERLAVQQEVMQLIALAGLARGGFFEKAAFYGGTCLHLFYGMERGRRPWRARFSRNRQKCSRSASRRKSRSRSRSR